MQIKKAKKKVKESQTIKSFMAMPTDANPSGNVHGGTIMRLIDITAAVVARRHCREHAADVVTAIIDNIEFLAPAHIGDLITAKASLNYAGCTSMEIGVKVEVEDLANGKINHISSSYVTFVALDKYNKPTPIPQIIPETKEEKRRFQEGEKRAKKRKEKRQKKMAK